MIEVKVGGIGVESKKTMSLPKVAYFCMEVALDQSLYTYSGGLGFLAGSHLMSAHKLDLPMVGITILWANGYGEQEINGTGEVKIVYNKRQYDFLEDTGVTVEVDIFGEPVKVKALKLPAGRLNSVPVYFLTTDIPENTEKHRELTSILYAGDEETRISQEIILGRGGYRLLEALGEQADVIHINEGHALPALFEMLDRFDGNLEEVKKRAVFTTHTPVAAGNETHSAELLARAGFFAGTSFDYAVHLGGHDFSLTVGALRMCRVANGVSQLHGKVANDMWHWVGERCPIVAITNAVNQDYWQDPRVKESMPDKNKIQAVKKQMKQELFDRIHRETGKRFDPDILTIIWARRFTEYKRAGLIFTDYDRIAKLLRENKIQLLYGGKFHPNDTNGRKTFNAMYHYSQILPNMALLPNYGMELSGLFKRGADVWLNTPLRPLEASGTSGMSANLNAALHFSTLDGWAVEGTYDGINGFVINARDPGDHLSVEERNHYDYEDTMRILEDEIIPMYYEKPDEWGEMMINAVQTAEGYFQSNRMVIEYFNRMYKPVHF